MAVKPKKPAMGVNKWEEELARRAQATSFTEESVSSGGAFLSTRNGRLSFNGGEVPGNKLNVIILGSVLHNAYYKGKFDAKNPAGPVCYAFGVPGPNGEVPDMEPHEKSTEVQHSACHGCPMNAFGSSDTGRGKACKNIRRLAVIPEDEIDNVEAAQVAYFHIPVTSVKAWSGYIQQISKVLKRPPFAVITEISVTDNDNNQFDVSFKLVSKIDDGDQLAALMAKSDEQAELIAFPYPPDEPAAPVRGRGKAAPAKFAAPAAKPARKGR